LFHVSFNKIRPFRSGWLGVLVKGRHVVGINKGQLHSQLVLLGNCLQKTSIES